VGQAVFQPRYPSAMRKLLLILPGGDGQDVGEAWVAFKWASHLAERNDLTVLTYHKRGRTPASSQLSGMRVVEWTEPPILGRAERFNSMAKPAYIPFYFRARRWIQKALERGEHFDLAFQPIPVAMRYPSPVAGLGLPFVIGPVGGSLPSPPEFRSREQAMPWYLQLRRLDRFRLLHDPLLRKTYMEASCVLGIAPYVRDLLEGVPLRLFKVMSETALDQLPGPVDRAGRSGSTFRLLFVGRLVPTKGAQDAIRALSYIREMPITLDIVGDGFDRAACEALTSALGITDRVRFHGRLPREQVDDLYRAADAFLFPSYREPGGNVTFEAMGFGLPLIVSDIGGPGAAVDDTCGFRVKVDSPDQFAKDIAAAVATLARDVELRHRLGHGSRQRVADIGMWPRKAKEFEDLCDEIAARPPAT
jgi:glycosyltransferase involved in cell wall biosynthesis